MDGWMYVFIFLLVLLALGHQGMDEIMIRSMNRYSERLLCDVTDLSNRGVQRKIKQWSRLKSFDESKRMMSLDLVFEPTRSIAERHKPPYLPALSVSTSNPARFRQSSSTHHRCQMLRGQDLSLVGPPFGHLMPMCSASSYRHLDQPAFDYLRG